MVEIQNMKQMVYIYNPFKNLFDTIPMYINA